MRRREFIALLGSAALAWPRAARAQTVERLRRIGVLSGFSESEMRPLIAVFLERLKGLGWSERHDIIVDVRVTEGDVSRLIHDAGDLIGQKPDVIVAQGTPAVMAVRQHTRTVPVVFVLVADPVNTGLIESLAHPGGNTTGITNFEVSIGGKWLELLREFDPQLTHVGIISNPANPTNIQIAQFIERAGSSLALNMTTASVKDSPEIEAAVTTTAQQPRGGLIILPDSLTTVNRELIVRIAAQYRLPAVYPFRIFSSTGGLVSYGLDFPELFRKTADYVDGLLRGADPSDLPVQAPTKFELVINLKTAKALGLAVPPSLLATADEVIE